MRDLRDFTNARVSLGRAGDSLPTRPLLDLRLAHAHARDAVYWPLDMENFHRSLAGRGWPAVVVSSAVRSREEYLRRPDLGRVLDPSSEGTVTGYHSTGAASFIVGDGLSALAIERHAVPLLERIFEELGHTPTEANPVVLVRQARVAIGDEIGSRLGCAVSVLLIGERPGLSSPDSLGVYLTWQPTPGRTDAERNCISNVHGSGLSYGLAAFKTAFLVREMQRRQLSGVALKDTSSSLLLAEGDNARDRQALGENGENG